MNDKTLILSSLKSRWLTSLLSVFLTAFGVALAVLLIQFGHHVQKPLSDLIKKRQSNWRFLEI